MSDELPKAPIGTKPLKQVILSGILVGASAIAASFITVPSEGTKFKSYLDGGKIPTICKGHTKGVRMGMVATRAQCDQFFIEDMRDTDATFDRYIHTDVPENVKAAALDFIFNTGPGNFKTSTIRKLLNSGAYYESCHQYPRWKFQGQLNCELPENAKICGGLPIRRQKEKALCLDRTVYRNFTFDPNNVLTGVR